MHTLTGVIPEGLSVHMLHNLLSELFHSCSAISQLAYTQSVNSLHYFLFTVGSTWCCRLVTIYSVQYPQQYNTIHDLMLTDFASS